MNQRSKDIKVYYDFAERCDDDYALMVKTLKLFVKRKPSQIKQMLEMTIITDYVDIMKKVTEENITTAKLQLINEAKLLF